MTKHQAIMLDILKEDLEQQSKMFNRMSKSTKNDVLSDEFKYI